MIFRTFDLATLRLALTAPAAVLALSLALPLPLAAQGPAPTGSATGPATGALAVQTALPQLMAYRRALAEAAAGDAAIAEFYRARDYAPLWTGPEDGARRAALITALSQAPLHALPAGRHDAGALMRAFAEARSEGDRGRLEVGMSRAFLQYARDIQTGVLVPSQVAAPILREVPRRDRGELIAGFAASDPDAFLRALPPAAPEYARLMRARAMLERQVARGGWGPAVTAPVLRPGDSGAQVVELRNRLIRMGYLGRTATLAFDGPMQAAVQAFQIDHGLDPDGVAGEATMAAINIPPEVRLQSITVAMERERWINIPRGKRHIWVNLADFTAKIVDDGKVSFETRAVIGGRPGDRQTPEFSHRMTYMELNPDWTVPRGIIRRDYLPALQRNPHALRHLQVIDRAGRVVPREAIDFSAYTAGNFPFNLRQPPGRSNALGLVKFMFPNPHAIYLHDSPEKHLFSRESRAYSSGCVRLADPFEFAYALLAPQTDNPRDLFHSVLNRGRPLERIYLDDPVPIHLEYRTAFTTAKGRVQYRNDIYGRDAAIWEALSRAGVALAGVQG